MVVLMWVDAGGLAEDDGAVYEDIDTGVDVTAFVAAGTCYHLQGETRKRKH